MAQLLSYLNATGLKRTLLINFGACHLMVFREKVALLSQPGAGLDSVITQARALDMETMHKEIAEQEAQQKT